VFYIYRYIPIFCRKLANFEGKHPAEKFVNSKENILQKVVNFEGKHYAENL